MDLTTETLSVSLSGRRVLDAIDLALTPGGVTVILGANGSGKTTLVKALAGLIAPDAGGVTLDGAPVATLDPRVRARRIGYLPQDGTVHWNVAVRDLVALGRLPHRAPFAAPSPADDAAIAAAFAATGTAGFADRRVDTLSGGERARILLARVLAGQPDWLLADEPLANLDPVHQLSMLAALRAAAGQGMGVVIVLHDFIQAARAADTVVLLRDGALIAHGPVADALTPDHLRDAFGVEVMMVEDAGGRKLPIPVA